MTDATVEFGPDGFRCSECGASLMSDTVNLDEGIMLTVEVGQHFPPESEHEDHVEASDG